MLEVVNLALMATNDKVIDIIMNFTALTIIAEFDNFLYDAANDGLLIAKLLEDGDLLVDDETKATRSLDTIL